MSEQRDPLRWLDSAPPDVSAAFLDAAREYPTLGPRADRREHVWQQLEGRLGLSAKLGWTWTWISAGVFFLVGVSALWFARPAPRPVHPPPPPIAAPVVEAAPAVQAAVVAPLPQPAPVQAPKPRHRALHPPAPPPTAAASTGADELQLLVRARRLVRSAPERALELAEQHRANFPRGTFAEERELLAIEALQGLGRNELAASRAHSFEASFPASAHRRRIEALVGRE